MPIQVFISFSDKDSYFVDLLYDLLTFHGLTVWCSIRSLSPGTEWRPQIHTGLEHADLLIVVVSKHSARSNWVKREVAIFRAAKPNAPIVSLRLDEKTKVEAVDPDLTRFQFENIYFSMSISLSKLFKSLNVEFLPKDKLVVSKQRRASERRQQGDRRLSSISTRLRVGFWKAFQAKTNASEFDIVDSLGATMHNVFEHISKESTNYKYYIDNNKQAIDNQKVLSEACNYVYSHFRLKSIERHDTRIIYIIDGIADYIISRYIIEAINPRRLADRRRPRNPGQEIVDDS